MIQIPGKRQFSRRRFLELGATAAGGVIVAAAGQPSLAAAAAPVAAAPKVMQASTVTLQMWKAPHKPAGEEIKIAQKVLTGLHDANPGIAVEYTEVPWDKYAESLTAAFASGTAPDITYQTEGISTYAIPGQLQPLDDYFSQAPGLRDAYLTNAYIAGTISGKLYGMPWVYACNSLIWNKDLFEQA